MAKSYEQWLEEQRKETQADAAKKKTNYNTTIDNQVASQNKIIDDAINFTTGQYDTQINETHKDYAELYDVNEVQRKINERNVAERMANLGLTDSGLNRTQQTALQLSHGNAKMDISQREQKAVDSLKSDLAKYVAEQTAQKQLNLSNAEASKAQYALSVDEAAENTARTNATALYNQQVEAAAAITKARIEAQAKVDAAKEKANITYQYTGVTKDDGSKVFTGSDGKTYTFGDGYNPYTRENNNIKYSKEAELYGFFSNGYQPKGIEGYGKLINSGKKATNQSTGRKQNLYYTKTGNEIHLWVWNGEENRYIEQFDEALEATLKNETSTSKNSPISPTIKPVVDELNFKFH